ncbi:MAG: alpha/beta hydrolase [Zetaproteobacteria bacterium]|nr:MAG: alpha/beta hydrolase [Zetaproteobacteria bacterium]
MLAPMRISWLLRLVLLVLVLSGCSMKKGSEVYAGLWQTWEQMDTLLQEQYPDAPPVILVHGWNGGEFTWPSAQELMKLEQALQRDVFFFTYRTGLVANRYPPIEILEEKLDRFLAQYRQVDVVAHSMGGLLIRQYLSHHAENPIRRIVFLSTPHFGTGAAKLLAELGSLQPEGNIQAQEIQPGSDFLWVLNEDSGIELEGHAVLNVLVAPGARWLEGDIVVDPTSAWLPWHAVNIAVRGDHHLGRRLLQMPRVLAFLREGRLPEPDVLPLEHRAWVRFLAHGKPMSFTPSRITHLDDRGRRRNDFSVCCEVRAGLYPLGGNTLVLQHIRPEDTFIFYAPKGSREGVRITGNELISERQPIVLVEKDLAAR